MREQFEFEGTITGEYKEGLYAMYNGVEYPAVYLGVGRFILYSDTPNEYFTFPAEDGRFLLQTDLRDELLTRANDVRMIGIVKGCHENVMIREIYEEGIVISTYNPRLAFELHLKPVKELGFTGMVDRNVLIGIYEERDYLWNPKLGIYATFCQSVDTDCEKIWFADQDRMTQVFVMETGNRREEN